MLDTLHAWATNKKCISTIHILRNKENMLPPDMGLEPMTLRLKVWCSTDWANRAARSETQVKFEAYNDFLKIVKSFNTLKTRKWIA